MAESKHTTDAEETTGGDFRALQKHVTENPLAYVGVVGFIVLCAVVALLYRLNTEFSNRDAAAVYAQALESDDAAERVIALDAALKDSGPYTPLALYMKGEAAYEEQDYEAAKSAFEQLREEYSDFEFVPDAVEGLGYILEDQGDLPRALTRYNEIAETWPESFAGRRQSLNIGRCQEKLGNMKEAVAAYREQLILFPGSSISVRAQIELNRLRSSNPELFEEELAASDAALEDGAALLDLSDSQETTSGQ